MVEILEQTSLGGHRPVYRCEATGANFGDNVIDFSFRVDSVGCALSTVPENGCKPVHLPQLNETTCDSYFAVVPRGNCSFSEKAYYVQQSVPVNFNALIVYNDPYQDPVPMSGARFAEKVKIPVVMVNYDCMQDLLFRYNLNDGYIVAIKVTPGYYDLIKYLVPFGAVISFCLIVLLISLVIRLCRDRRRLARKRLSRSNLKKLPVIKFQKNSGMYETCAVCLEDFEEGEKLRQLPCKHAYHMKCIDPWLTKNRKVCPVCKRKVGPSNGSDSSDSESERGTTTTSMSSSQINPAAIATGNPGSSTRDSVPLLRYEQPMAMSTDISNFRLDLSRIGNGTASASSSTRASSIEEVPGEPRHSPEQTETRVPPIPRFLNRMKNFVRRVTATDYNPHTILDNDISSVNEDDVEGVAVLPARRDRQTMSNSSSRSLILEPLPQRSNSPTPQSSDSEVEVIPNHEPAPGSPPRDNLTPPPSDPHNV